MYVRGVRGTIAARTYEDLLPEDEAWNRDDAQPEQFYIVRFRQKDPGRISFENDTLCKPNCRTAGSKPPAIDRNRKGDKGTRHGADARTRRP